MGARLMKTSGGAGLVQVTWHALPGAGTVVRHGRVRAWVDVEVRSTEPGDPQTWIYRADLKDLCAPPRPDVGAVELRAQAQAPPLVWRNVTAEYALLQLWKACPHGILTRWRTVTAVPSARVATSATGRTPGCRGSRPEEAGVSRTFASMCATLDDDGELIT